MLICSERKKEMEEEREGRKEDYVSVLLYTSVYIMKHKQDLKVQNEDNINN